MRDPFVISSIAWHEISEKVAFDNSNAMEDVLNENLNLFDYGSGLKAIAVVFIAVQSTNTIHEEVMRYSHKKKEIYIQKKLPYELVCQYEKPQVLQLMAVSYLEILTDLKRKHIPDFDLSLFQQDVQKLFTEQNWLNLEKASL